MYVVGPHHRMKWGKWGLDLCEELTVELATETAILFGSVAAICAGVWGCLHILDAIITPPPALPSSAHIWER